MNKGIIMEIKRDYAIALNDQGIMEKIISKQNMQVGQKIFYFEEDIVKEVKNRVYRHTSFMKAFGSIAALFLIVFTFFNTMKADQAYAIVSLDINPSIQMEVDSKQQIIKVEGVNDDGKNIDFSDIKDIDLDEGIQKIKEKLIEKNYLDANKEVLVGFAFTKNGEDSDYEKDIQDAIQSTFNTETVTFVKGEKEDIEEAKTKNISLGRYEASLKADEETKKKIDKAPVKDITASIKDKEDVIQWQAVVDERVEDEKAEKAVEEKAKTNETPAVNTNSGVKPENATPEKPVINPPVEKDSSNVNTANPEKGTDSNIGKAEDNKVLELEPEAPVTDNKKNDTSNSNTSTSPSKNTSIDIEPNNEPIKNNTTSGKIQDSNNKTSKEQTDTSSVKK